MKMVNCPHCGMPLVRDGKCRYFCENEGCPVVFVHAPHNPLGRKVAFASSATAETVRKTQEAIRASNLANIITSAS
ncbi:MAG TPA: hypothetical protein VMT42_06995 [candidate division Zixibacteria bacterium]|nr:hypothetical protein [candidate division Zixibacteria bacterium]